MARLARRPVIGTQGSGWTVRVALNTPAMSVARTPEVIAIEKRLNAICRRFRKVAYGKPLTREDRAALNREANKLLRKLIRYGGDPKRFRDKLAETRAFTK